MKRLLLAVCVLTAPLLATAAHAQPVEQTFTVPTTAALAELCADTSSSNVLMTTAAQNFCHGYMLGTYEILAQINAARGGRAFCIPTPAPTRNQAIADFVSWAKANPSKASLPPADGVYVFLTQRFPCPAGQ
jgi:hypothetical protein